MAATSTLINGLLDAAFRGQTYTGGTIKMHLYTVGLPSATGVEVAGGSYAAQTLTFSAASAKTISTSANAVFSDLPTGTPIVAYGIKDGSTLIDEKLFTQPFTPDVTNNELEVSYSFNASGV